MKIQATKTPLINIAKQQPTSAVGNRQSISAKKSFYRVPNGLLKQLFSLFDNEDKKQHHSSSHRNSSSGDDQSMKQQASRSLLDIENCANAARETEAYSQSEWMDKTDE